MLYKGKLVSKLPVYLYEISIYVHFKNRHECLFHKFITCKKLLSLKCKELKKTNDYTIIAYLDLINE